MKLEVGKKEFSVKVAKTPEAKTKGLLGVKAGSMPKDAGLVLKYDIPTHIVITMVGMRFPIDVIFIKDNKVQKVICAEPGQDNIEINDVSDMALEVIEGHCKDTKPGDAVEWKGEKKEDGTIEKADGGVIAPKGTMHVLDENGKVQTNIKGDERIFSRKHTDRLFELAEKASKSKNDNDYKKLGMAMMQMIDKQDTQKQEYTKN